MKTNRANYEQQKRQLQVLIEETEAFTIEAEEKHTLIEREYTDSKMLVNHWRNRLEKLREAQRWLAPIDQEKESEN